MSFSYALLLLNNIRSNRGVEGRINKYDYSHYYYRRHCVGRRSARGTVVSQSPQSTRAGATFALTDAFVVILFAVHKIFLHSRFVGVKSAVLSDKRSFDPNFLCMATYYYVDQYVLTLKNFLHF